MRILILLLTLSSITSLAQKKKKNKEETPPPVSTAPVPATPAPAEKNEAPKDTTKSLTVSQVLTQHFARKYAMAVQWSDYDVAKDALYDVIAENPGNDSLIFDLAYYYFQSQKYPPAVLIAEGMLKRNPKNLAVLEISALGLEQMGATEKALERFESLYLIENNPARLYKMAFLQYTLKRYVESNTSIDILLKNPKIDTMKTLFQDTKGKDKEFPMRIALLNLKGMVARDSGKKEEARKYFNQALTASPDFAPAKKNLDELKPKP